MYRSATPAMHGAALPSSVQGKSTTKSNYLYTPETHRVWVLHFTFTGSKELAILTAVGDLPCRPPEAIVLLGTCSGPRNVDDVKAYPNPAFFEMGRGITQQYSLHQAHNTKRGSEEAAH